MEDLPDDHDCKWKTYALSLKAELQSQLDQFQLQIDEINGTLKKQQTGAFRPKSEKLVRPKESKNLTKEERQARKEARRKKRDENRKSREALPERPLIRIKISDEKKLCQHCGDRDFETSLNTARQVEIIESQISSLFRQKYEIERCRCRCGKTFVEAKPPPRALNQCEYGPNLIAQMLVSKVLDSMPFYRQSQSFQRQGLHIADSTLAALFHKSARLMEVLYQRSRELIQLDEVVLADETTTKYLPENRSPLEKRGAKLGWVWCFLAPRLKLVNFVYDTSRAGAVPVRVLGDSTGYLLTDGYSGYNQVTSETKNSPLESRTKEIDRKKVTVDAPVKLERRVRGCHAHARRKFKDCEETLPEWTAEILETYQKIYKVESDAKSGGFEGEAQHLAMRQTVSLKAIESIRDKALEHFERKNNKWEAVSPEFAPKSMPMKALHYFLNQYESLCKYTENAVLPIDNNASEPLLRKVALLRKNSLFVGSPESGQRTAVIFSLASSCVLNGVNPLDYFRDVLVKLTNQANSELVLDIDELLPNKWKPPPD